MKKLLCILLAALMVFSMVGCGNSAKEVVATAEQVTADLQGAWILDKNGSNTFTFNGNDISINGTMNGTFTVNTETKNVEAIIVASNGQLSIDMPYDYVDGSLVIYNNQGDALEKQ